FSIHFVSLFYPVPLCLLPIESTESYCLRNQAGGLARQHHIVGLRQAANADPADDLALIDERHAASPPDIAQVSIIGHREYLFSRRIAQRTRFLSFARGGERLVDGNVDGCQRAAVGAKKGH